MPETNGRALRPALPVTVQGLMDMRRVSRTLTLNDHVETVYQALWPNEQFRAYLDACYDAEAVEGSLSADNQFAAIMIRDYAREHNMPHVANKKIAILVHALKIVMKRYNMSRHLRANMIGGVDIDEPHPHHQQHNGEDEAAE